jgi:hypothetical protein
MRRGQDFRLNRPMRRGIAGSVAGSRKPFAACQSRQSGPARVVKRASWACAAFVCAADAAGGSGLKETRQPGLSWDHAGRDAVDIRDIGAAQPEGIVGTGCLLLDSVGPTRRGPDPEPTRHRHQQAQTKIPRPAPTVEAHEARVTGHVSGDDGRQSPSDPNWLLLLHGQAAPRDTISARMPSAASLGFGARLVNKCTHWSPKATLVELLRDAIPKSDVSGASVAGRKRRSTSRRNRRVRSRMTRH